MSLRKILTPVADLHETGGLISVPVSDQDPNLDNAPYVQELVDRDAYLQALLGGGEFQVSNGQVQIKMTNKTGVASVAGQLVSVDQGVEVSGGGGFVISATITGKTNTNSKAGRLWYKLSIPGGLATVQAYSDEAKTALVAHGALGDNLGGTVNLAADGGSGIGGTVVLTTTITALDTAAEYLTCGSVNGFQKSVVNERDWIGVCGEAGVADGSDAWVTIGGTAQMLIEAAGDVGFGDWVRSGETTAGRLQADSAWDPLYSDRYIGRSVGRKEAGVGTTCGVMMLPRRAAALPAVPADGVYNLTVAAGVASWTTDTAP